MKMPLKSDEEVTASAVAKAKAREATKISLKSGEMTEFRAQVPAKAAFRRLDKKYLGCHLDLPIALGSELQTNS